MDVHSQALSPLVQRQPSKKGMLPLDIGHKNTGGARAHEDGERTRDDVVKGSRAWGRVGRGTLTMPAAHVSLSTVPEEEEKGYVYSETSQH